MLRIALITLFILFSFKTYAVDKYGDIIERYNINGVEYIVTQEATYQEVLKIDPKTKERISIKGVFGFGRFAKECEMIEEKPIFFAGVKEYYFAGGWPEPTYITMFDVEGNKLGISPDWEYAEQFCVFYN